LGSHHVTGLPHQTRGYAEVRLFARDCRAAYRRVTGRECAGEAHAERGSDVG